VSERRKFYLANASSRWISTFVRGKSGRSAKKLAKALASRRDKNTKCVCTQTGGSMALTGHDVDADDDAAPPPAVPSGQRTTKVKFGNG
jgi:hypothetical protein